MTPLDKSKALIAMLCEHCHEGYQCSLCKLHQFLTGCERMANGSTPKEAYETAEEQAEKMLNRINRDHDEKLGLKIEV